MSLLSDNPVLDVRGLLYPTDGTVLRQVHLAVGEGETVAVLGPGGAGKSVLKSCLAGELDPAGGTLWTNGKPFHLLSPEARRAFRLRHYGLVYQDTVFLPELDLADNTALPLRFTGVGATAARRRALIWLERFEIADTARARPPRLPVETLRRAALARAMVNDPLLLLADEPFSDLPPQSADTLGRVLLSIALSHGTAVLVFTRDPTVAASCQRTVNLVDGRTSAEPVPVAAKPPVHPAKTSVNAPVTITRPDQLKVAP